jgi:hypothetical protein
MTEEDDFVSVLEEPYDGLSDAVEDDYIFSAELEPKQSFTSQRVDIYQDTRYCKSQPTEVKAMYKLKHYFSQFP